jgi:hypothetical protein
MAHSSDDEFYGDSSWFDDDLGDGPRSRWSGLLPHRWRNLLILATIVAVVGIAVVAARLVHVWAHQAAPAVAAAADVRIPTSPVPTTAARVLAAASSAPTSSIAPATTATAHAEVTTLQTVPALRDVVVVINARQYVSAPDGSIAVDPADRHGAVEVVGIHSDPPLLQATFTGWADGVASATRALDEVDGPVAQLGFTVAYRVEVVAGTAADGTVSFDSVAGAVSMPIGVPTFLAAARAVASVQGLTVETITYTARTITRGKGSAAITAAAFTPAPEALWRVLP